MERKIESGKFKGVVVTGMRLVIERFMFENKPPRTLESGLIQPSYVVFTLQAKIFAPGEKEECIRLEKVTPIPNEGAIKSIADIFQPLINQVLTPIKLEGDVVVQEDKKE
jgi:hypothetical protein